MGGAGQLWIPPSEFVWTGAAGSGSWVRGIPTPGVPPTVSPVGGIPDCKNLLSASPPTLLERFEVYSYSIGWGVLLQSSAALAAVPQAMVELAFLVNDRPAYVIQTTAPTVTPPGDNKNWVANGSFVSDLVNPMDLGARDRLAIRVGASSLTTLDVGISIVIGTQFVGYGAGAPTLGPFESTISYRVIDVPASRRL